MPYPTDQLTRDVTPVVFEDLPAERASVLISLVIVCYNQAPYLRDAINSVLAQSYQGAEILLVDDGSTDQTSEIAHEYPQVRYIRQNNRGLSAARNTGLHQSRGRYVVFLDADDRLLPNALDAGLALFREQPDCGFVFGAHRNIFHDGSAAPTTLSEPIEQEHYWHLLQSNFIGMHATVMYSRDAIESAGGFNENLRACEDYEMYLRIARRRPVRRHGTLVAEYRQHDTNMSRDHAFMLRSVLAVLRAERKRSSDNRHRHALRLGMSVWKEYYGTLLLEEWQGNKSMTGFLKVLRSDLHGAVRWAAKALVRRGLAVRERMPVRFGSLRRLSPFSRQFGLERGQPVDRYYIESFLAANADCVRGRVMEIGDDTYSRRFGADGITRQDILHVVPDFPGATIIADLANAPQIPSATFDCVILTQTLHYIFDLRAAVATLVRILKPGGTILATLPGISQVCRDQEDPESDCWRFTASSAKRLFHNHFRSADVQVATYGNVLSATAFLYGLPASALTRRELDHHDPDYQLIISVAVRKAE
jgi:glycosyltransferase involved in cell wall biosynthesis